MIATLPFILTKFNRFYDVSIFFSFSNMPIYFSSVSHHELGNSVCIEVLYSWLLETEFSHACNSGRHCLNFSSQLKQEQKPKSQNSGNHFKKPKFWKPNWHPILLPCPLCLYKISEDICPCALQMWEASVKIYSELNFMFWRIMTWSII